MNMVQRFFRRYIFFMTGTMMLFLPPTAHRFRWSAKNGRCLCTVQDDRAGIARNF